MTRYKLRGFFRTALAGTSAFVIPFFVRPNSNSVYTHELDESYRITAFIPLRTNGLISIPCSSQTIWKEIGEDGVLGFHDKNGEVKHGGADSLKKALDAALLNTESAFFRLDAGIFLKSAAVIDAAIKEIASTIPDPDIAKVWARSTRATAHKYASNTGIKEKRTSAPAASEQDVLIKFLMENPKARDWYRVWRRAWEGVGTQRTRLVQIAVWWARLVKLDHPDLPSLLRDIARRGTADITFSAVLNEWLIRNKDDHLTWLSVWSVARKQVSKNPEFENLARSCFRAVALGEHKVSPLWWVRTFRSVRTLFRDFEEMKLILDAFHKYEGSRQFISSVVVPSLRRLPFPTQLGQLAFQWLMSHTRYDDVWARLFLAVVRIDVGRAELSRAGVLWLQEGDPNLRIWKNVWLALRPYVPNRVWVEIGEEWIRRVRPQIRTWPEVFLTVYEFRGEDFVIANIDSLSYWLAMEHSTKHRLYEKLMRLRNSLFHKIR